MLKAGGLLLLLVAATVAALAAASAGAHNDPCHAARTCPSDDHSYVWSGMSCTSSAAKRLPEDQLPVDWRGIRYWCHVVTDTGMGGGTARGQALVQGRSSGRRHHAGQDRGGGRARRRRDDRSAARAPAVRRLVVRGARQRRGDDAVPAQGATRARPARQPFAVGADRCATSQPARRSSPASPNVTARSVPAPTSARAWRPHVRRSFAPAAWETSRPPSHCAERRRSKRSASSRPAARPAPGRFGSSCVPCSRSTRTPAPRSADAATAVTLGLTTRERRIKLIPIAVRR